MLVLVLGKVYFTETQKSNPVRSNNSTVAQTSANEAGQVLLAIELRGQEQNDQVPGLENEFLHAI